MSSSFRDGYALEERYLLLKGENVSKNKFFPLKIAVNVKEDKYFWQIHCGSELQDIKDKKQTDNLNIYISLCA